MFRPCTSLTERELARFWAHVDKDGPGGCWIWNGSLMRNGYGAFRSGLQYAAHRVAYTVLRGEIPIGLDLDHLCRVRRCVNPDHVEPVTRAENLHRSPLTLPGQNIRKTHCSRGHDLANSTIHVTKRGITKRICVACRRLREGKNRPGTCHRCGRFQSRLRAHLQRKTSCVDHPRRSPYWSRHAS